MYVNISLRSARENAWRKTVKTLNLPLHKNALHIIVQENDQQIKKNIKFPEFCKIFKFPFSNSLSFPCREFLLAIFPVFPVPWVPWVMVYFVKTSVNTRTWVDLYSWSSHKFREIYIWWFRIGQSDFIKRIIFGGIWQKCNKNIQLLLTMKWKDCMRDQHTHFN